VKPESRRFLFACVAAGFGFAVAAVAYRLAMPGLLDVIARAIGSSESETRELHKTARHWEMAFPALLAIGYAIAALVHARRKLGLGALATCALALALYLASELALAPRLVRALGLNHYDLVRDPDHWPRYVGEGWNSDLLAQTREASEYPSEAFNIVFLGDSFTMGLFLDDMSTQAFPHQVERLLRAELPELDVRVANFGWTSSSPILSLRRLEAIGERYHPDLVAIAIDMTDFHDDIRYGNLIERRGITALYDRLPILIGLLKLYPVGFKALFDATTDSNLPLQRYFHSEQPLEKSLPYLAALEANLGRIEERARAMGADFAVFVLPRNYQYSDRESPEDWERETVSGDYTVLGPHSLEPFRFFEQLGSRVDYPIYSLLDDFRSAEAFPLCLEDDPHWTLAGHEVAARAIARRLRERIAP